MLDAGGDTVIARYEIQYSSTVLYGSHEVTGHNSAVTVIGGQRSQVVTEF